MHQLFIKIGYVDCRALDERTTITFYTGWLIENKLGTLLKTLYTVRKNQNKLLLRVRPDSERFYQQLTFTAVKYQPAPQ